MAVERHLIEIEEILRLSGADNVKRELLSVLNGIAEGAEGIARRAGGGAGGQAAASSYARQEVSEFRRALESESSRLRQSGGISAGQQGTASRVFSDVFRSMETLPAKLQQFLSGATFETQKAVRAEVRSGAAGAGGAGVIPPTFPPGAAGKGRAPEPEPPTRGIAEAATQAARDSLDAIKKRTAAMGALLQGGEFAREQADNVRAGYQLHAAVLEELGSTNEYARAKSAAARYQAQNNAQTQRFLAVDGEYARARAQSTRDVAIQHAAQEQLLAVDGTYARAQATITRSKAVQSAAQQQILADDDKYGRAQAVAARAKAEQSATLQEHLTTDNRYLSAQRSLARSKAEQQSQIQSALASDSRYTDAQAQIARAKSSQQAAIQEDLASTGQYATSQARAARAKAEINARTQAELASTGEYAAAQARATRAKAEITAREQAALSADNKYIEATVAASRSRDITARQVAEGGLRPRNLQANVDRQLAEQRLTTARSLGVNQALLNEPGQATIAQQAALRSTTEAVTRQRNIILEQNRMEEAVLEETGRLNRLKRERNVLERAATESVDRRPGESIESLSGRTAAREEQRAAQRRIAQLGEIDANTNGIRDELVKQRVLEARINRELEQEARAIRRAETPGGRGVLEGGSWFQRLQATIQTRRTGDVVDPERLMGLGQFVASRAVTTAGFALSGAVLYGGVQAIRQMVTESENLQRVFSTIQAQFQSIGQGGEFSGFRAAMFDISRETGVAASEVATVGFQLKGVYGTDTQRAIRETAGAIKVATVTGIEQRELTDSLTAASLAYGTSIEGIGDKAVGLEERFGVLAKESLKVFGDMSAVAKEAGLDLQDLGAIVGTIQQASGRSGQSVAEALGRILPGIGKQALPIAQLYAETPALRQNLPDIQQALAAGETGKVLTQLIRDWDKLDQTTKNYVVTLLGGRREASTLIPLFNNSAKAVEEMNRQESDAGKTSERFGNLQATLAQAIARFRAEMVNLGNDLLKLGLLDAFRDMAAVGGVLIRVLDQFVRWFGDLNRITEGIPARMLSIALAIAVVTKAIQFLQTVRAQGVAATILGPVAQAIGPGAAAIAPEVAAAGVVGGAEQLALPLGGAALGAGAGTGAADLASLYLPATAGYGLARRAGGAFLGSRLGGLLARVGSGGSLAGLAGRLPGVTAGGLGASAIGGAAALGAGAVIAIGGQKMLGGGITIPDFVPFIGDQHLVGRAEIRKQTEDARDAARKRLERGSLGGLLAARGRGEFSTGWLDTVRAFGIGESTTQTLGNQVINEKTLQSVELAKKEGLLGTFTDKELKALRENHGGGKEGERARRLLANLPADQQKRLQDAIGTQRTRDDTLEDIMKNGGQRIAQDMQTLATQFQMGNIGWDEYISKLRGQLSLIQSMDTSPETHAQVIQLQQTINGALNQHSQTILQTVQHANQMAGIGAQGNIATARKILDPIDPTVNRVLRQHGERPEAAPTPEERALAANTVWEQTRQAWLDSIKQAPNAAEAQRLLEHPPELDEATKKAIKDDYKAKTGLDIDPTIGATYDEVQQQRQNALNEQTATITARYAGSRDPQAQVNQAKEIAAAQLADAQRADATKTQLEQAKAAQADANAQQLDVDRGIAEANVALTTARDPRDRLTQARAAQDQADIAQKYAQGKAAEAQALAQRIQADQAMRDAMYEISQSRIRLLQAQATAAGDDIEAARLNLQATQNDLDKAIQEGADEGVINDLTAQRDTAKNQLRQTTLQEREDVIQFNLDMERITIGQAIEQLTALMSIANPKEQRDLMRRIKSLRDQAGKDLQFNIPSEIKLPTLYEVRRYEQSGGGAGYQDNRNVNVVMHVNNGMDQAAAGRWLSDTVGRSPRVIAAARRA